MDTPDILTVKQLAAYLHMAEVTIYRLAATGQLPGRKIGGQWRFRRDLIDQRLAGDLLSPDAAQVILQAMPNGRALEAAGRSG